VGTYRAGNVKAKAAKTKVKWRSRAEKQRARAHDLLKRVRARRR